MKRVIWPLVMVLILAGCAANETLTPQQVVKQQKIDTIIADALFDAGLNDKASYNIDKNGGVNILFGRDVPEKVYTKIVNQLRSDPRIPSLYAEQGGKEVCIINQTDYTLTK